MPQCAVLYPAEEPGKVERARRAIARAAIAACDRRLSATVNFQGGVCCLRQQRTLHRCFNMDESEAQAIEAEADAALEDVRVVIFQ